MTFAVIERHERADGTEISVGRDRHGEHLVVLDALGGLEATIRFTDVDVDERTIEFKYSPDAYAPRHATVVTLERDDFGPVEAFLEAFDPREVEA